MLEDSSAMLRETARRFATQRLAPNAARWDEEGKCPNEVIAEMGRLGLLGMTIPEAYGGVGASYEDFMAVMEEIAAGDGGVSTIMHVHQFGGAAPIVRFGTEAQKRRYLPSMASGEVIGAFCLTEPNAGSDAAAIRTRAKRDGAGWVIDGTKQFISNGSRAGVAIVFAATSEAGEGRATAFIVPTDTPGYKVGRLEKKLGQHSADTTQILLDGCRVPHDAVLGEVGRGLQMTLSMVSDGRISIGAQAVGMARAAFEHALGYAKQRVAFGKPIIDHQAVAFRLADMATRIEVARVYVREAARLLDAGVDASKEASIAKLFATEIAERVCSDAIQVFGGYGYLQDYPVERIYRDVRVCQIYEGTSDIQRLIIARKLAA